MRFSLGSVHAYGVAMKCGYSEDDLNSESKACRFVDRAVHTNVCHYCSKNPERENTLVVLPAAISVRGGVATTQPNKEMVATRRDICGPCPNNRGITERFGVPYVKCGKCTTCEGGRSLTAAQQTCPEGKW